MLEVKGQLNALGVAQQIKKSGGGGSALIDYSTTEHVIGKWTDGTTDVYEITLALTSPTTADTSTTIHSFDDVVNIIEFDGVIDGQYGLNTYWDNETHIRTWINVSDDKSNVRCNVKGSLTINKPITMTIRYTKPTV